MRVEIARLHKEIATMIKVTHDQVEAMTLADKIVVLRAGHAEQVGAPMDLYHDPENKFVAGFIGSPAMNFLDGISTNQIVVPALNDNYIDTSIKLPADGSKVTVGLRPKALRLNISKTGLKIDIHERLGGVSYAYLNSPTGERIIVEIDDDNELSTGQDIGLEFDHGAALFFDETTDKRLR